MKIICDSSELYKAASTVQRTVSSKSTIHSLEGILIESKENGEITLTGYDLEVGSIAVVNASVEETGSLVLNAKNLCDILRMLPSKEVLLQSDERNICRIKSGQVDYSLIGISSYDYPALPSLGKASSFKINLEILKDMIRKTIFSVSVGERNPVHSGIKFEAEDDRIVLVAVDGARLAIRREYLKEKIDSPFGFICPTKPLNEVLKINGEEDDDIEISVGERHIIFKHKNYEIISRLIEGNFINYKSAIPGEGTTKIKADAKALIESIERTSLIIVDKSVPLKLLIENGEMKFSSVTAVGTACDFMTAEIEGNDLEIGFNNKFLVDAVKASEEEIINLEFGSSSQPIVIKPEEGDRYYYLVLPVRI